MKLSLPKEKKLKKRDEIQSLFKEGKRIKKEELHLIYLLSEAPTSRDTFKVGVSVPKKKFKRAVDRNKLKRLIREGFRLNQVELEKKCKRKQKQCLLMFVFQGTDLVSYAALEPKIVLILRELEAKI